MAKQSTNPSVLNLIEIFNSISKCIGFSVLKPSDSLFAKFLREIVFLSLFSFSALFTYQVEIWCFSVLKIKPSVKKIVIFAITQIILLSPLSCLLCFRLRDFTIWKIVLKVKNLEDNLIACNTHVDISQIASKGLFFWFFQFFIVMSMVYVTLWPMLTEMLIDFVRLYYYEAWTLIPYLQFVVWICFLSHVLHRMQLQIIEIHQSTYLTSFNLCIAKERVNRMSLKGYEFRGVIQIKTYIAIMKQVLNISKELSTAYGATVLICIVQYSSRLILQFYDLIDRDTQFAPMWQSAWNIGVRMIVLLPAFICCERFSFNVNKTLELIQEIVMLYQPSCLDYIIFESLILRLRHQNATIRICGFLNMTYRSFLAIMTTAVAFLVFQLQFKK